MKVFKKCMAWILCVTMLISLLPSVFSVAAEPEVPAQAEWKYGLNGAMGWNEDTYATIAKKTSNNNWREALATANGEIAIMESGDPDEDVMIFNNTKIVFDDNGPHTVPYLADIIDEQRVGAINYNKWIWNQSANAKDQEQYGINGGRGMVWSRPYMPAGQYRIKNNDFTDANKTNYNRYTNYETSEVGAQWKDAEGNEWDRRTFASREDDVIVTYIEAPEGKDLNLTISMDHLTDMRNASGASPMPDSDYVVTEENGSVVGFGIVGKFQVRDMTGTKNVGVKTLFSYGGWATSTRIVLGNGGNVAYNPAVRTVNNAQANDPQLTVTGTNSIMLITKVDRQDDGCENVNDIRTKLYDRLQGEIADLVEAKSIKSDEASYQKLLAPQAAIHGGMFNNVRIELCATDEEKADRELTNAKLIAKQNADTTKINKAFLERIYNNGRFGLICAHGYGSTRLGAIWCGTWAPDWSGDYTLDANTNLQVSGLNTGNMMEAGNGYINFILRMVADWELNAAGIYGMTDAILGPPRVDGTGQGQSYHYSNDYPHVFVNGITDWLLIPIFEYWQCYGNQQIPVGKDISLERNKSVLDLSDEDIARITADGYMDLEQDILYPLSMKAMNFWLQYVDEKYYTDGNGVHHANDGTTLSEAIAAGDKDAKYIFAPGFSPENRPSPSGGSGCQLAFNVTMDISAAHDTLFIARTMLAECGGDESKLAEWAEFESLMPDYVYETKTGELKEWATTTLGETHAHRHESHAYAAWPGYEAQDSEDLREGIAIAMDMRAAAYNGSEATESHGATHKSLVEARLKRPIALERVMLYLLTSSYQYTNMLTSHNKNKSSCLCTDSAFGLMGAVNESLLYSNTGIVEIVPTLLPNMDKGSITGLRARNNTQVDVYWDKDAKSAYTVLTTDEEATTLKVMCGLDWDKAEIDGEAQTILTDAEGNSYINVDLTKGEPVEIDFTLATEKEYPEREAYGEIAANSYDVAKGDFAKNEDGSISEADEYDYVVFKNMDFGLGGSNTKLVLTAANNRTEGGLNRDGSSTVKVYTGNPDDGAAAIGSTIVTNTDGEFKKFVLNLSSKLYGVNDIYVKFQDGGCTLKALEFEAMPLANVAEGGSYSISELEPMSLSLNADVFNFTLNDNAIANGFVIDDEGAWVLKATAKGSDEVYETISFTTYMSEADSLLRKNQFVKPGANVALEGNLDNAELTLWFAPAGTTVFASGSAMSSAAGNSGKLKAPAAVGEYYLYVVDGEGKARNCSDAKVRVCENPNFIDFTDPINGDRYVLDNPANTKINNGTGLYLVSSTGSNESGTAQDLVKVPVTDDWTATMKFDFEGAPSSGSSWFRVTQNFVFLAMDDYNNAVGIRTTDTNTIQDYKRINGTTAAAANSTSVGLGESTIHWFKIVKEGDDYTCFWSTDGEEFEELFKLEDTGIEARYLAIDSYSSGSSWGGSGSTYKYNIKYIEFTVPEWTRGLNGAMGWNEDTYATIAKKTSNNNWREALATANGEIAIMESGDPNEDVMIFNNTKIVFDDNGPHTVPYLADIIDEQRVGAINYNKWIWNQSANAKDQEQYGINGGRGMVWSRPYMPAGQYRIKNNDYTDANKSNYNRYTNYETAEVGAQWKDEDGNEWNRRTFASREDDVIVTYIEAPKGQNLNLTISMDHLTDMRNASAANPLPSSDYVVTEENGSVVGFGIVGKFQVRDMTGSKNVGVKTLFSYGGWATSTRIVLGDGGNVAYNPAVRTVNNAEANDPQLTVTGTNSIMLITKVDRQDDGCENVNDIRTKLYDRLQGEIAALVEEKEIKSDEASYQKLLAPHAAIHGGMFNNVRIELCATAEEKADRELTNARLIAKQNADKTKINKAFLERIYNNGRFGLICAHGYGSTRLGAIWCGTWGPDWSGDYTLDANTNLQVSGLNTGNMMEAGNGYINFILRMVADWEINAESIYGMTDAILGPPRVDGTGQGQSYHYSNDYPHVFVNGITDWLLIPMFEYWQCYGDQKIPVGKDISLERNRSVLDLTDEDIARIEADGYMDLEQDILYPLSMKAMNFWLQFVDEKYYTDGNGKHHANDGTTLSEAIAAGDKDAKYIFAPGFSPENRPSPSGGSGCQLAFNVTMDIAAAHDTLFIARTMLAECGGDESKLAEWAEFESLMPDYVYETKTGELKEWATTTLGETHGHRHESHAYAAWPGYEAQDSEELREGIAIAMDMRAAAYNGSEATESHGATHKSLVEARLKRPVALERVMLYLLTSSYQYTNMLTSHNKNKGSCLCTDSAFGLMGAVNESLLYSNTGIVEILPTLLPDMDKGFITGLRARNNTQVDIYWDENDYSAYTILTTDEEATTLKVMCGLDWDKALIGEEEQEILEDAQGRSYINVDLVKGESVEVDFVLTQEDDSVIREAYGEIAANTFDSANHEIDKSNEDGSINETAAIDTIKFNNMDFGINGSKPKLTIVAANSRTEGGLNRNGSATIAVYTGDPAEGYASIGSVVVPNTNGEFKNYVITLNKSLVGVQDIYIKFQDGGAALKSIKFEEMATANVVEGGRYLISPRAPFELELNPDGFNYTLNGASVTNGYKIAEAGEWTLIATSKSNGAQLTFNFETYFNEADTLLPKNASVKPSQTIELAGNLNDPTLRIWIVPEGAEEFAEGKDMTCAAGDSNTIKAPRTMGVYELIVVNEAGDVLSRSEAAVKVRKAANYMLADTIEAGKQYVIVSNGYALTNVVADVSTAYNRVSLASTPVTVVDDVITSEVSEEMIWDFAVGTNPLCGDYTTGYYVTNGDSKFLSRNGPTNERPAPLNTQTYDSSNVASKPQWCYWVVKDLDANGNKAMFLTATGEWSFALRGAAEGFDAPGSAANNLNTLLASNPVKFYEVSAVTGPEDIDFTDSADAEKFEIVNQASSAIREGEGLYMVTTKNAFETANGQLSGDAATTPKDLVLVPVEGDWEATLEFVFNKTASNGYYQFFGFYAMADYNNCAGIRGGDGALQNFLRVDGAITADSSNLNSAPGLATDGATYWFRIVKEGDTYTCFRSADGEEFTEMFAYENTGIEADKIAIDAYTGMTEGYSFLLKSLSFGNEPAPHVHDYVAVVTAPTCTEAGYTTYTCACGDSYVADEVAALGHDLIETKVEATCTAAGSIILDCSRCDYKDVSEIPALGHDFVDGICTRCGENEFAEAPFEDVAFGAYYFDEVVWAVEKGITNGIEQGLFAPDSAVTRAQIVTMLWRAAGCPQVETAAGFKDVKAGEYYADAVAWAVENGITNGVGKNMFAPNDICTRGQIVTFLWRYMGKPAAEEAAAFIDVPADEYYADAVAWAVEADITTGITEELFKPENDCTRAQAVTFIWRIAAAK